MGLKKKKRALFRAFRKLTRKGSVKLIAVKNIVIIISTPLITLEASNIKKTVNRHPK